MSKILIADTALITINGILFQDSYYTCAIAVREKWFMQEVKDTKQINVYYDPSCLDSIFIVYEDIGMIPAYKVTFDDFQSLDSQQLNLYYQTIWRLLERRKRKTRIKRLSQKVI
ncbi:hypothetical protein O9H85_13340 [Paenibacillus filicis]|uniref:Transposase-like Mu C-terminal domain-containing protein n=1 Tax=Paenibacillus gyeongsangnamensis TaxID=3388067 RepID=A0ABT4Q948_9BACL|nr:hypothetical protein [Paenibacillus filicis]MCZ8513394.1 hypothetical protein [Paenibacillus filicis]